MKPHLQRLVVTMVLVTAVAPSVHAEIHLELRDKVALADLIVRCKSEVDGATVRYRVVEVWKGKLSPELFYHDPDQGCFRPPQGFVAVHGINNSPLPADEQECIIFLSVDNQPKWTNGKFLPPWPSLRATEGKIVYPSPTEPPPPWGGRKEYTMDQFKRAVLNAVMRQRLRSLQMALPMP